MQKIVLKTKKDFHDKNIILFTDGAFGKIEILERSIKNNISAEFRIAKKSKVILKNQPEQLKNIRNLQPKGKQASRTIKVAWHKIKLYITAQKRINKTGKVTIVYQVSTYCAKASKHIKKDGQSKKCFELQSNILACNNANQEKRRLN